MADKKKPMFDLGAAYYPFEDLNESLLAVFKKWKNTNKGVGAKVLDVGCGRTLLGAHLSDMGYVVSGIEVNEEALKIADSRISQVFPVDLNDGDAVTAALAGETFDYIIFADVLEHLPDPLSTLKFYRRFLKDDGRLLVSLPNVAVWYNRFRLFFGRFDYTDSGVMDRTHLKFFTFRTAKILLHEAGFAIQDVRHAPGIARAFIPTIMALFFPPPAQNETGDVGSILKSPAYRFYAKFLEPIETFICSLAKGLLAFRIILVAGKDQGQDLPG